MRATLPPPKPPPPISAGTDASFLGYLLFGRDASSGFLQPAGIIGSIIGAIIVLLVYLKVSGGRSARTA